MTFSYFNTSHVTVYHFFGAIARRHAVISIHLMLRFIINKNLPIPKCIRISIHLMLRFIEASLSVLHSLGHFNTSHVTVYHYSIKLTISTSRNFNTSHVTVYPVSISSAPSITTISIHLMLRFISLHLASRLLNWNFNTSHVTVYHISRTGLNLFKGISIHLMLRFIRQSIGRY